MVQPFSISDFIISNFLLTSCDLVRTVSHDRGLGYSNSFDSAEFVHVPHTWSSSFAQNPRNLSHRILGTSPVSSELDIPNETDIPRVSLTASPTCLHKPCPGFPGVIRTLPSHGSNHRVAQNLS